VSAGSQFDFHVVCHERRLPETLCGGRWLVLLDVAFDHAFAWLGFGAKTAVGYGAMAEVSVDKQRRAEGQAAADAAAAERAEAERLKGMTSADREWALAQPVMAQFRSDFEQAPKNVDFNPSGTFNQSRLNFMKTALTWTEARTRAAAGQLLEETATKKWGRPTRKERWQELQQAIAQLKGGA
jgi:CRISPR-associated protein Cmr6